MKKKAKLTEMNCGLGMKESNILQLLIVLGNCGQDHRRQAGGYGIANRFERTMRSDVLVAELPLNTYLNDLLNLPTYLPIYLPA